MHFGLIHPATNFDICFGTFIFYKNLFKVSLLTLWPFLDLTGRTSMPISCLFTNCYFNGLFLVWEAGTVLFDLNSSE